MPAELLILSYFVVLCYTLLYLTDRLLAHALLSMHQIKLTTQFAAPLERCFEMARHLFAYQQAATCIGGAAGHSAADRNLFSAEGETWWHTLPPIGFSKPTLIWTLTEYDAPNALVFQTKAFSLALQYQQIFEWIDVRKTEVSEIFSLQKTPLCTQNTWKKQIEAFLRERQLALKQAVESDQWEKILQQSPDYEPFFKTAFEENRQEEEEE